MTLMVGAEDGGMFHGLATFFGSVIDFAAFVAWGVILESGSVIFTVLTTILLLWLSPARNSFQQYLYPMYAEYKDKYFRRLEAVSKAVDDTWDLYNHHKKWGAEIEQMRRDCYEIAKQASTLHEEQTAFAQHEVELYQRLQYFVDEIDKRLPKVEKVASLLDELELERAERRKRQSAARSDLEDLIDRL